MYEPLCLSNPKRISSSCAFSMMEETIFSLYSADDGFFASLYTMMNSPCSLE